MKKLGRPINAARRADIAALWPTMLALKAIGRKLGCAAQTVSYHAKAMGLPKRECDRRGLPPKKALREDILRLRKRGLSYGEIAKLLNQTRSTVAGHIFRAANNL